jgi:hypothetical protein
MYKDECAGLLQSRIINAGSCEGIAGSVLGNQKKFKGDGLLHCCMLDLGREYTSSVS